MKNVLRICILGLALGFLAKFLDNAPIFGALGTNVPLWVFVASLISIRSKSAGSAALRVLVFFVCVLISYYLYTWLTLKFFPQDYAVRWAAIAILSAGLAFLLWFGQGKGILNAALLSLPIALISSLSYSFFYTQNIVSGIEFFLGVALFFILPRGMKQRTRVLLFAVAITVFLDQTNFVSYVLGGL